MKNIMYLDHTSLVSGAEVSLLGCIEKLNKDRYFPILACPPNGPLVERAKKIGVRVETVQMAHFTFTHNPLKLILFGLSALKVSRQLVSLIKKYNIDLVHANSIRAGILGGVAANLTHTPIIWHIRDFLPDNLTSRVIRWLSGWQATKIIVISEAVRENFAASKRQENKIALIYVGVDVRKYDSSLINTDSARKGLGLTSAYPIVGIIGQIIDWKGQKEFLQAAGEVCQVFPEARFLVVGEALFRKHLTAVYKQELINLARKLRISDKVLFTGFREDILSIIAALDILVVASWREPLGRVEIEAMAAEKPIVATKAGGIPEVVEEGITGVLVPPRNPQAIANAVVNMARNRSKLAEMGREGRRRVQQYFSLDNCLRKTEQVYHQVLYDK